MNDFEKLWKEMKSMDKGVLLWIPEEELFVSARFGTGDNLLREDIRNGYNDYIYIRTFLYNGDFIEYDGGMVMFNNESGSDKYEDYYDNLEHTISSTLENIDLSTKNHIIIKIHE